MTTILTIREKSAQFRQRLEDIRPSLNSRKGWKNDFFNAYPDFNNAKWSKRLDNVVKENGATPVEEMLIALEEFAKTIINDTEECVKLIRSCETLDQLNNMEAFVENKFGTVPETLRMVLSNKNKELDTDQRAKESQEEVDKIKNQ